jgi:hypothetical protein
VSTPVRLAVFVAALVVVFVGALGLGNATGPVGPVGAEPPAHDEGGEHADASDAAHASHEAAAPPSDLPGGLAVSTDGYTLALDRPSLDAGRQQLGFRVLDDAGRNLVDYDVEHEKQLHLIVVRRDLTGFQHVHPRLDATGHWQVPLDLTPGSWRVLADFTPAGGTGLTLGADLAVPGQVEAPAAALPTTSAQVDDYEVRLDGSLVPGEPTTLTLEVSRDGEPVTDLQPYLGAYGHLVALREGDLAYVHVHPEDGPAGPTIAFGAEAPSPGRYHLFLDFQHDGVVRTASFVVDAGPTDRQEVSDGDHHADQH